MHRRCAVSSLKDKEGVFGGGGSGEEEFGKSKEQQSKKEDAPV